MRIGNIELKHGVCLAPLAGVSDRPFRLLARRYGAEYAVTEMVSAKALCYEQRTKRAESVRTAPLAALLQGEHPTAVQLFGAEPDFVAEAARLLESGEYLGACGEILPAAIDINMGCPMQKIVGNGEGSALMKDPARAEAIVRATVEAVSLPVTVKLRSGWDAAHVNAVEMAKRVEQAGASMICIHARTRQQMYAPRADWSVIAAVKRAVKVPVVGNGDIFSADDALRMMRETDCDGVMIARGAQGNPWIFSELIARMEGRSYTPPTTKERLAQAMEHAGAIVDFKGERAGIPESRKHVAWYLSGIRGAAAARDEVMRAVTLDDYRKLFEKLLSYGE